MSVNVNIWLITVASAGSVLADQPVGCWIAMSSLLLAFALLAIDFLVSEAATSYDRLIIALSMRLSKLPFATPILSL